MSPEKRAKVQARQRRWMLENPDRVAISGRNAARRRKGAPHVIPGVDERCAICGIREDRSSHLHLDHCHASGAFRGWLCGNCNRGIGLFRDAPDRLGAARDYVTRWA